MVKLKGPLMSLGAHGSLDKVLTYAGRKSGHQTRKYSKPTGTASAKQRAQRRLTEFLVAQWQNMTEIQKNTWEAAAKASDKRLAGYHYFLREAQRDLYTNTGMLAYWHCNVIDNNRVLDLSGQDQHSTLVPASGSGGAVLAESRSARFSKALSFNGIDQRTEAPETIIPASGDFTIDGWLNCAGEKAGDTGKSAVSWGALTYTSAVLGVGARLDSTTQDLRLIYGDGTDGGSHTLIEDITSVNKNKWYNITMCWDASEEEFIAYINGVHKFTSASKYANSGKLFNLGHSADLNATAAYWYGLVDEVCIYNRILSAAEVLARYRFATAKV